MRCPGKHLRDGPQASRFPCALCFSVDNSEYMRNGDFLPTRLQAQQDAVNIVCHSKTRSNPENNVGLITLAKYVGSGLLLHRHAEVFGWLLGAPLQTHPFAALGPRGWQIRAEWWLQLTAALRGLFVPRLF